MRWTEIYEAKDVTQDIIEAAEMIYDGWFSSEDRIDWEDFFTRLDGFKLLDGTRADLGGEENSSAIKAIKQHINEYKAL